MQSGGKSIAVGMLIYTGGEYLWEVLAPNGAGVLYTIGSKIAGQMAGRGWTEEAIEAVMNNPSQVGTAINRATGNAATAFFDEGGAYVVKDNVTNEIIQISNKNDLNWIMDSSIKIKPTL